MSNKSELNGIIKELKPYIQMTAKGGPVKIKLEIVKLYVLELRAVDKIHKILTGSPTFTVKENVKKLNDKISNEEIGLIYDQLCSMRNYIVNVIESRKSLRRLYMAGVELLNSNNVIMSRINKISKETRSTVIK